MESREHTISRVTLWGAVANTVLAVFKLIAGITGHSAAMIADAIHSFSDLISDAVILVMVKISCKGNDKSHDFGHGKFETLATVAVSLLLVVAGVEMMTSSIEKIKTIICGGTVSSPGQIALWAAAISIAVKEALYQWTVRVGKKVGSSAMIANAWHHRSDALSSVGALAGIGGAMLLGGKFMVLDPAVGCIISIVIIVMAVKMSIPALEELTEASLPDDIEKEIIDIIHNVNAVDNVHGLKTRRNGHYFIIAAHVVVDPLMTVARAHDVTIRIEEALKRKFGADTQISIHVEPDIDAE